MAHIQTDNKKHRRRNHTDRHSQTDRQTDRHTQADRDRQTKNRPYRHKAPMCKHEKGMAEHRKKHTGGPQGRAHWDMLGSKASMASRKGTQDCQLKQNAN